MPKSGCENETAFPPRDWLSYPLLFLIFLYMKFKMILNSMMLRLDVLDSVMHDKISQFENAFFIFQCIMHQARIFLLNLLFNFLEEFASKMALLAHGIQQLFKKMLVKSIMAQFKLIQCLAPNSVSNSLEGSIEAILTKRMPTFNMNLTDNLVKTRAKLFLANDLKHVKKAAIISPENLESLSPLAIANDYVLLIENWAWVVFLFVLVVILVMSFFRKMPKKQHFPRKTSTGKQVLDYALHGPSWLFLFSGLGSLSLAVIESRILSMATRRLAEAMSVEMKEIIVAISNDVSKYMEIELDGISKILETIYEQSKQASIQPMVLINSLQDVLSQAISDYLLPVFKKVFGGDAFSWAAGIFQPVASIIKCVSGFDSDHIKSALLKPLEIISANLIFPLPSALLRDSTRFQSAELIQERLYKIIDAVISREFILKNTISSDEYLFAYILIACSLFVIVIQSIIFWMVLMLQARRNSERVFF